MNSVILKAKIKHSNKRNVSREFVVGENELQHLMNQLMSEVKNFRHSRYEN